MLCKYSNIFGKPKEGIHSIRIYDIAIIDVILTIIFSFIISYYYKINFYLVLTVLFIIGEILHLIFCVNTTIINYITNLVYY